MAPESFMILHDSISDALDKCDEELQDWKFLHSLVKYGLLFKLGIRWQNVCCIGPLFRNWVFYEVRLVYDVYQNYMVCSHHALELLQQMTEVDHDDIQKVIDESRQHQQMVQAELENLRAGYPSIMKQVDTHHCKYYTLKQLYQYYCDLGEKG